MLMAVTPFGSGLLVYRQQKAKVGNITGTSMFASFVVHYLGRFFFFSVVAEKVLITISNYRRV